MFGNGSNRPVDLVDGPAPAPRGREAERILAGEMLAAFRDFAARQSVFNERLAGRIINHVLEVGTVIIDANGFKGLQFHVAAGAIEVENLSSHQMTVVAASPSQAAPTSGIGVYIIPAGVARVVNIASRTVTIYGTTGEQFSYQATTFGGVVASSIVGVDGGVG